MNALQQAIDTYLEKIDIQELRSSSQKLSAHYREGGSLTEEDALLAYLIVRLPATYASLHYVLSQLPSGNSFLDLGAGPGTVWWAIQDIFESMSQVTAIEREARFIALGKQIGSQPHWIHRDICTLENFKNHDWIIFGYSLGELPKQNIHSLLERCWKAASKGVVIVEPGTPRGYQNMLAARDFLIKKGGYVLAPCPHSNACPLKSPDWCHFGVRLERSFLHRQAKLATLPFEDEKFSYAIISKENTHQMGSRIIRPPMRRSGHVVLPLCTPNGLDNKTISRKQKDLYKKARKASWGDWMPIQYDADLS